MEPQELPGRAALAVAGLGSALVVVGAAVIYWPAAIVALGLILLAVALLGVE